jgi:hypothetical protein
VAERMPTLEEPQLAAVSRFFSSAVLRELARLGRSPLLARLLRESQVSDLFTADQPLRGVFDFGLKLLAEAGSRQEYVYKDILARRILLGQHSLRTAVMLSEFRVGKCKADLAILNGTSTVYEIKSERDRLNRLPDQLDAYLKVFARVNVIAGANHVEQIMQSVPDHVGVLVLSKRMSISTVRAATEDTGRIVPDVVFDSLQLHESAKILERFGLDLPTVPNTQLHAALRERFVQLAPQALHSAMIHVLRSTRSQARLEPLLNALPSSLRAAALSMPLRKADHGRITSALNVSMQDARGWAV